MSRYFIEVSYRGTGFHGFQSQHNAYTVQAAVETALQTILRRPVPLTGSSRTDAGVHALQNYFHADTDEAFPDHLLYKLNAVLPSDISVKRILPVASTAHCRFDAEYREYNYFIYNRKNPFLADRAYYYPYRLDWEKMQEAASLLLSYQDFTSFSKRNTQVRNFHCRIIQSGWEERGPSHVYVVRANRFLRGMVRALTATMLEVGRGRIGMEDFRQVIEARDCTRASFAVPAHGLFLVTVGYPDSVLLAE